MEMDFAEWTRIEAGIPETRQSLFRFTRKCIYLAFNECVANVRTFDEGRSHCRVRLLADRISKNRIATAFRRRKPSSKRNLFSKRIVRLRASSVTSGVSIAK